MLKIGIVGLPNVGKSTLFNALTRSKQANVQNYPFCTIEPNVGIVEVPDERLKKLADISHSKKIIPAVIEFVDIAGLVAGASMGEGLGNQFLAHIREVDAIVQVVRSFSDQNIIHAHNKIDPQNDAEVINLELIMADLSTVSKRLENLKKQIKSGADKITLKQIEICEKIKENLGQGKAARELNLNNDDKKLIFDLNLLTIKPMIYVVNCDEKILPNPSPRLNSDETGPLIQIEICAKLEADLANLNKEEAIEYLKNSGINETGLDKLIKASYELLGLITYLTSGEPETRAWTIKQGTKAPEAAGVIHTDFIKGFIKANVIDWQNFIEYGGWEKIRETGKMRLEGKEYIVKDGDVIYFHINPVK